MKNKQIKRIKSYATRYRYLLAVLVVIGALLVVSNSQLQTGYPIDTEDSSFIVPGNDLEMGSNETIYLTWQYKDGNLIEQGFTVYNIQRVVYGEDNVILLENTSVPSGDTITYAVIGVDFEPSVIIFQLMLYRTVVVLAGEEGGVDIYWDQVTVQIYEGEVPTIGVQTTTTTSGGGGGGIGSNEIAFVNLIIMLGAGLFVMGIGSMIYMRVKR